MKTLMVCALGHNVADYKDYPIEWRYLDWTSMSVDAAVHMIRISGCDRVIAHGLGCYLVALAKLPEAVETVFIEPFITQFPKQSYVLKYVDMLPDFMFRVLAWDVKMEYRCLLKIKRNFDHVRLLAAKQKQRALSGIKVDIVISRGVHDKAVDARSYFVQDEHIPYIVPYKIVADILKMEESHG